MGQSDHPSVPVGPSSRRLDLRTTAWPEDSPDTRVIVGTWRGRQDWESWHEDPEFLDTRTRLDELQAEPHQTVLGFDVIQDARAEA